MSGNRFKELLKNDKNFKLINEFDGKRVRILMDNDKSFKLIDPKTGKTQILLMDDDKSFKLVKRNDKDVNNKSKKGYSFRLLTTSSIIKKKKNDEKILDLNKAKNKNEKNLFKEFFTEKSFNLLEMMITIVLVIVLSVLVVSFVNKRNDTTSLNPEPRIYETINDARLTEFIDLYTDVITNYYNDIDSDELLDVVTKAMLDYLGDAYSGYLDEYEARNLKDRLEGQYNGLGIEIATRAEDNAVVVTGIFEGSPASESDIKVGDVIKSINEVDVVGKNSGEISILIKDKLTGTVTLVVERDKKDVTVHIKKGVVEIQTVESEIFDNTGYIKITSFSKITPTQVQAALKELESQNITSLIVDVRSNSGGYLNSAYNVANLFISKNKIIYKLQTNKGTTEYKATSTNVRNYPVAVLINGGSASASEVFALAMRDSYGSKLIGAKSYGKGTVQETTEMSTGSLVKYTIANWLGPNNENVNGNGIKPDIDVSLGKEYLKEQSYKNDTQLQEAIKAVNE